MSGNFNIGKEIMNLLRGIDYYAYTKFFPEHVNFEYLTYDEIIQYYLELKKEVPAAACGILLEKNEDGFSLTQMLIDQQGEIMYKSPGRIWGRKINIKEVSSDLLEFMGKEKFKTIF